MKQKRLIESCLLAVCIAALYFLGEAFKAISPIKYYRSPIGINQILIWSSLRFALLAATLFCIVHFGVHSKNKWIRRLSFSAAASFVLVCFAFGLLHIADIRLETFIKGVREGKIYLLAFIAILTSLLFIHEQSNTRSRIIDSSKTIAVVFAVLLVLRIYSLNVPLISPYPEQKATELKLSTPSGIDHKRRVVFVVFDEFDPIVAFSKQDNSNSLKNFKKLIDGGFYAPNALPPAKSTIESIPAMMIGKETQGNTFDDRSRLFVKTGTNEKIEFNQENSLFGKLPGGPSSLSILGFYHPYCKIYPAAECVSFPLSKFAIPNSWRFWNKRSEHQYITATQLKLIPSFVESKYKQLAYLHLNIPHLDANYAANRFHKPRASTAAEQYSLNLALSDQVLGSIVNSLERSSVSGDEVLLIVCSDHWFRSFSPHRDESNGLPALLAVKLLSDRKGIKYDKTVSTHHLTRLVIDFLHGDIKTHMDVSDWFHKKSIYKTYIDHELVLDS
jgi:hypothetical protein